MNLNTTILKLGLDKLDCRIQAWVKLGSRLETSLISIPTHSRRQTQNMFRKVNGNLIDTAQ